MKTRNVFVAGGTGYVGQRLIPVLLQRGHRVRALVRPGSESKLAPGCDVVLGDALRKESFADQVTPSDTYIQLVGVPHPSPAKARLFRTIDLVSVQASVAAAQQARVVHFIYVSVAQPAPIMKDYQAVRAVGEALLRASAMNATILRPWYVLGPGHRWPYLLLPAYWIAGVFPATREPAKRLGLVHLSQMVAALAVGVEQEPNGFRIVGVPEIRAAKLG